MTSVEPRPIEISETFEPTALLIQQLSKSFSGKVAVDNVGFRIGSGEMVALVGASGSGKSTLLRCLNGLYQAESGAVEIFGSTLQSKGKLHSKVRQIRAQIGFIFQQFNLVNRLSALENVLIGNLACTSLWRSALRVFSQKEKATALAALERVGILDQAYKRAALLSGGQQQRVAIARCLMQGAKIILADEPIASLDPESAHRVMKLLTELNQEQGITVVTSLHQVQMVRAYFPRAIALQNGQVRFDGAVQSLNDDRLKQIYGAAVEELVRRGHSELSEVDIIV